MIIGYLPNFSSAFWESENLKLAFNYLKNCLDKNEFPLAKVDIKGEEVYAIYSENGMGRELQLESHLKYIDIHFVIEGTDRFAYAPTGMADVVEVSSNVEKDLILYLGNFRMEFELRTNFFVVFFSEDIHSPCYKFVENKKLVLKVAV